MRTLSLILSATLLLGLIFTFSPAVVAEEAAQTIVLTSTEAFSGYTHGATLNGSAIPEYDYVWHIDPTKKEPYYTGTAPSGNDAVYIAHDIYYYPLLDESKFKKVSYDGETEWVYFYEAEGLENYIFSTLPNLRSGFPSQMMHSPDEAYDNAVLHITKAGTYKLQGEWHGQIRIDLGEDSFTDPTAKVTLILDNVNIQCTVASGIVFAEVYECDNEWEMRSVSTYGVDTKDAGAVIRLADGSTNNVSGTNIFRLLKAKYKDDESKDTYPAQKKLLKTDGALYSYRSMNIEGSSGTLNITSGFEGMNSELHLTINGGNVNINSQDDGINVNEDGVSVLTVNGGNLHICAGLGAEGDGIDSNGYLVVNDGTVISAANPGADSGMDSDKGSYVFGGTVVSLGSTMDWAKSDNTGSQAILNMRFASSQSADEAIIITDSKDNVIFAYDPDKDEAMGKNSRTYSGAVLSSPNLKVGETVRIYVGGNVDGSETNGVYDAASVKSFSGASRQCYTGNSVGGFGGGFGGGGERPDFGGEMPEGWEEGFGGNFGGGTRPERPSGNMPDFGGERPDFGGEMPEGFGGGQMPDFGGEMPEGFSGSFESATCKATRDFVLSEVVNAFSGVSDIVHAPTYTDSRYVCSVCGETIDEDEVNLSPEQEHERKAVAKKNDLLLYLCIGLGALLVICIVAFIIITIQSKKKQETLIRSIHLEEDEEDDDEEETEDTEE